MPLDQIAANKKSEVKETDILVTVNPKPLISSEQAARVKPA